MSTKESNRWCKGCKSRVRASGLCNCRLETITDISTLGNERR